MSEDLNKDEKSRKKSIKGYASSVFKESSVSAVAGILSADSIPRKIFRALIFLVFTVGFLYQCIKFLSYLLEYPTVVNIEIAKPETYLAPAFTFCNSQKVLRSKYCSKYPDHCITTDEEFCKNNFKYCQSSNIRVKEEHFGNLTKEDLFNLTHEDLVYRVQYPIEYPIELDYEPFMRATTTYYPNEYSICYSGNLNVNSEQDAIFINRTDGFAAADKSKYKFIFDPAEDDQFDWSTMPGILFSIHSQFDGVNPFFTGYFMKPGRMYKVVVFMQQESLLSYPYKTDCINYHDRWISNGRTGARSQEMCREKCLVDYVSLCFNCSLPFLLYPSDKSKVCDDLSKAEKPTDVDCHPPLNKMKLCKEKCKEACMRTKFYPEIREMYMSQAPPNSKNYRNPRMIYVHVDIEDTEVIKYVYKPQYQNVEAFSYIGGFIGIWLGISLVQVTDFFESIFLIARYFFKKRTKKDSNKA